MKRNKMNKYCMLYLTYKKANYLFLKKETFIALKMSIGNILPKGKFIILCLSITKLLFFFWNRELSI